MRELFGRNQGKNEKRRVEEKTEATTKQGVTK
jgi:hypothetical protein